MPVTLESIISDPDFKNLPAESRSNIIGDVFSGLKQDPDFLQMGRTSRAMALLDMASKVKDYDISSGLADTSPTPPPAGYEGLFQKAGYTAKPPAEELGFMESVGWGPTRRILGGLGKFGVPGLKDMPEMPSPPLLSKAGAKQYGGELIGVVPLFLPAMQFAKVLYPAANAAMQATIAGGLLSYIESGGKAKETYYGAMGAGIGTEVLGRFFGYLSSRFGKTAAHNMIRQTALNAKTAKVAGETTENITGGVAGDPMTQAEALAPDVVSNITPSVEPSPVVPRGMLPEESLMPDEVPSAETTTSPQLVPRGMLPEESLMPVETPPTAGSKQSPPDFSWLDAPIPKEVPPRSITQNLLSDVKETGNVVLKGAKAIGRKFLSPGRILPDTITAPINEQWGPRNVFLNEGRDILQRLETSGAGPNTPSGTLVMRYNEGLATNEEVARITPEQMSVANDLQKFLSKTADLIESKGMEWPKSGRISNYMHRIVEQDTLPGRNFDITDLSRFVNPKVRAGPLEERYANAPYLEDAYQSFKEYLYIMERKIFREPAVQQAMPTYKRLVRENGALAELTKDYLNRYLGRYRPGHTDERKLVSKVTNKIFDAALYGNIKATLTNSSQLTNTVAREPLSSAEALVDMMMRPEEADSFLKQFGYDSGEFVIKFKWKAGNRWSIGNIFDMVEFFNKRHALLTGRIAAMKAGLTGDAVNKAAVNFMKDTQFLYGPEDMPMIFSSPFGKAMKQFGTYPIKQSEFLVSLAKNDPVAFARWVTFITLIGGPKAVALFYKAHPGYQHFIEELDKSWPSLQNAIGVDIGSSVGFVPERVRVTAAPVWNMTAGLINNIRDVAGGKQSLWEATKDVAGGIIPYTVKGGVQLNKILQAALAARRGAYIEKGPIEKVRVETTPFQAFVKSTVGDPLGMAREMSRAQIAQGQKKLDAARKQRIISLRLQGNKGEAGSLAKKYNIGISNEEVNNAAESAGMTREQRILRHANPKIRRISKELGGPTR
jgi:hypothetical protein